MERSIDREIAKDVFVSAENDNVNGVITVGEKNGRADIGIIAVDETARGNNIGKKLMNKAEEFGQLNNYDQMQVVTQKANHAACAFYKRCGFYIDSVVNVYHLWIKK
jgi:dTDP-4-amino-4,6-dideoxy-D-galactose acyltransferase